MREYKFQLFDKDALVMRDVLEIDFEHNYAMCKDGTDKFHYDLDTYSMRQYAGLKDKNGKEIYEGDVVKSVALLNDHFQKGATNTLVVRNWMGNSCLCFEGQETGTPIYPLMVSHEIEIIGNIYFNPELLEVTP